MELEKKKHVWVQKRTKDLGGGGSFQKRERKEATVGGVREQDLRKGGKELNLIRPET